MVLLSTAALVLAYLNPALKGYLAAAPLNNPATSSLFDLTSIPVIPLLIEIMLNIRDDTLVAVRRKIQREVNILVRQKDYKIGPLTSKRRRLKELEKMLSDREL